MTRSQLQLGEQRTRGGPSQILLAVVAAVVVLLVGLLLALATSPSQVAPPAPRVPVTSSTPTFEPASQVG